MTIFYAGKVLVYDDFPNERAKELMDLADKGSRSSAAPPAAVLPLAAAAPNRFGPALEKPCSKSPAGEPNVVSKTQAPVKPAPQLKPQTEAKKSSDLPIARRASLHRFLAKRKDRTVLRAPYQMNQQPETALKASGSSSTNGPEPELDPVPEAEAKEDFLRHLDLNL